MNGKGMSVGKSSAPLRPAARVLLAGQACYIAATLLHAGGEANRHHEIFATYARNQIWTMVHLAQFVAMAVLLAGLLGLIAALERRKGAPTALSRVGSGVAIAALALYGALQAVDGVALKQAVDAWARASAAEQAARFAVAEGVRWIEWGMRSYFDVTMGLALLCGAALLARTRGMPALLTALVVLSALAYLAQGWIAGVEGFTSAQSIAIVAAWAPSLVWMAWLALLVETPA